MEAPPVVRLDILKTPLNGITLIEASAGTGKTWTITGLYLRLILESSRQVENILVVTYTKAATEELRDRIRQRLVEAREAFSTGSSDDALLKALLAHYNDHPSLVKLLALAVSGFERAAIFTIHSFCQRVLADSAFESAMPFETELLTDDTALLLELVEDYWRKKFHHALPIQAHYLLINAYTPLDLLTQIRPYLGKCQLDEHAYLQLLGPGEHSTTRGERTQQHFYQIYQTIQQQWPSIKSAVESILMTALQAKTLHARSYTSTNLAQRLAEFDLLLTASLPQSNWFKPSLQAKLPHHYFALSTLASKTKKGQAPPEHDFFAQCETLLIAQSDMLDYLSAYFNQLKIDLIKTLATKMRLKKQREKVQSYDDLLSNLHQALHASQGQTLAATLQTQYSAALIDEFQDTDVVQYACFQRIYAGSDLPIFFVGDPKQAIYSFRGADIFAYLQGRGDAQQHYTLETNWRSEPNLVAAVNQLFMQVDTPFLFSEITFQASAPTPSAQQKLHLPGAVRAPLHFWFVGEEADKPLNKSVVHTQAAEATAAEIAQLLNLGLAGEALIGDKPISGGDIAVLVRTNSQGLRMRDALMRRGIASVRQGQANVFTSHEAMELERVLLAMADPGHEALLRAALVTDFLGFNGNDLYRLLADEVVWARYLERYEGYHRQWRDQGFIGMFRDWLHREQVAARLLALPEGERRLTNVLHLAELLQNEANQQRIGLLGLLNWFADKRSGTSSDAEDAQMRLESDGDLVKIVTIHKSKGLEYPIVFCPFLWDGRLRTISDANTIVAFHDPEKNYQAVVDLGSAQQTQHRQLAGKEELAENLRLLYVALTRAKYRCYTVWGKVREAETSALGWLLYASQDKATEYKMSRDKTGSINVIDVANAIKQRSASDMLTDLRQLASQYPACFAVEPIAIDPDQVYQSPIPTHTQLSARTFTGQTTLPWWISSFSALTAQQHTEHQRTERPDHDANVDSLDLVRPVPISTQVPMPTSVSIHPTIADFPRGPMPGECLHYIFEHLDFTNTDPDHTQQVIQTGLTQFGIEPRWVPVVVNMLTNVLETPLDVAKTLRLRDVDQSSRLNEMEFNYPIAQLTAPDLGQLLQSYEFTSSSVINTEIERLAFYPIRGFMKGFIDLIFVAQGRYYIVDYKSNWLGTKPSDYHQTQLTDAMAKHAYYLQYLLYTIAVHRWLKIRLPNYQYETHFGGAYYLFLRGMTPEYGADYGVYFDRPSTALVRALDEYLATGQMGLPH